MSIEAMTEFGISAAAYALLIARIVATVASFEEARYRPNSFVQFAREPGGEHE